MLETIWFWLVAVLLTLWAVLDGFDLGVGVLHRLVAKTDTERRQVLAAIGPVWDGNEVWLLAAGGSMFLAFPRLLAAGFSGFYLPVIFVVWALMLRGISIELRSHLSSPLWRSFFDTTFMVGSTAVPVLMGAALGNVVRGVPLNAQGFFELPLFGELGVLDGFTVLIGVLVLVTLTAHGANWLVWKTDGAVQERVRRLQVPLWGATVLLWLVAGFVTTRVAPEVTGALPSRPLAWLGLLLVVGGVVTIFLKRRHELAPFLGGVAFIAGSLVAIVACLFPVLLRATNSANSITVQNAHAGGASMSSGLWWWGLGIALASGYFWWVMRHFQGKAVAALDGEGY